MDLLETMSAPMELTSSRINEASHPMSDSLIVLGVDQRDGIPPPGQQALIAIPAFPVVRQVMGRLPRAKTVLSNCVHQQVKDTGLKPKLREV